MAFTFGDFIADLKGSRYFQVWLVVWVGMLILFFVGVGNIATFSNYTANEQQYLLFRNYDQDVSKTGLRWPKMGFYTNNASVSATSFFCNTEDERIIHTGQEAYNGRVLYVLDPTSFIALPGNNLIGCIIELDGDPTKRHGTTWLFVDSGVFHADAEFVQIDSQRIWTVSLSKSFYLMSDGTQYVYWNPYLSPSNMPKPVNGSNATTPIIQVIFSVNDFNLERFLQWNSYPGWQVYADLGGILFASYVFQTIVMFFIGMLLTNDSRLLGTVGVPSRGAYESVS